MRKIFSILCLLCLVAMTVKAGDEMPKYDITGAGSGTEGTILVKVFVYKKNVNDQDLKRAAVHGVVFRGCEGNASGARQPAMASPAEEANNAEFCKRFFADDGECQNFASVVAGSYERVKTSKGYKMGAIVQVSKTSLRKFLEKAGIVRSLSSGF